MSAAVPSEVLPGVTLPAAALLADLLAVVQAVPEVQAAEVVPVLAAVPSKAASMAPAVP